MHQLADLAGIARREIIPEHEHLGTGDCPADGIGPPIDFLRRQERTPQHLGQPVHQEESGPRLRATERAHHRHGEVATRVGDDAQALERLVAE